MDDTMMKYGGHVSFYIKRNVFKHYNNEKEINNPVA